MQGVMLARAELLGKLPHRRHLGTKVITIVEGTDLVVFANKITDKVKDIKVEVKVDGVITEDHISQVRVVCDNGLIAIGNIRS